MRVLDPDRVEIRDNAEWLDPMTMAGIMSYARRFDLVHRHREVPADVPERPLPPGNPVHLPALPVELRVAASTSAARRLVDDGAVRVDGERLPARRYDLDRDRLAGHVLAAGKRHLVRLTG